MSVDGKGRDSRFHEIDEAFRERFAFLLEKPQSVVIDEWDQVRPGATSERVRLVVRRRNSFSLEVVMEVLRADAMGGAGWIRMGAVEVMPECARDRSFAGYLEHRLLCNALARACK